LSLIFRLYALPYVQHYILILRSVLWHQVS
jgi:hypothetical protein